MFWLLMECFAPVKDDLFPQVNLECSFRNSKVVFELMNTVNIWERLLKITRYTS